MHAATRNIAVIGLTREMLCQMNNLTVIRCRQTDVEAGKAIWYEPDLGDGDIH